MRISDWSSDVCSSDLRVAERIGGQIADIMVGKAIAPRPAAGDVEQREAFAEQQLARLLGIERWCGAYRGRGQDAARHLGRSEEQTSELQSLMRISYAVFCLTKTTTTKSQYQRHSQHT